jgi:hypothetical protein
VLMDRCFAEKRASKCCRSGMRRHCGLASEVFRVPGPAPTEALTIEAYQAGAKKLLQWKAGTQAQAHAPGVACDFRTDFK